MKRLLTALVLIPLITYVVVGGPQLLFLAVLSAVAVCCFVEYSGIVEAYGIAKPGPVAYVAGLLVMLWPQDPTLLLTLLTLIVLGLNLTLNDLAKGLPRSAAFLLGILYIFAVWRTAIPLRAHNSYWLLFALALNWVGDSAAYYVGRNFGKHKLAPRVSPGKSWEGTVGSIVASMIFAAVLAHWWMPTVGLGIAILVGGIGNVAGQIGDLAESALKRGAGVKDSGNMLPGHGGWLDRVDSALFATPVVYALVTWLKL